MKYFVIFIGVIVMSNCNKSVHLSAEDDLIKDINEDRGLYNTVLYEVVNYIVENKIFKYETDTLYIDPYSRIDTNSIHTYGIQNYILHSVHIDNADGKRRKMTDAEYKKFSSLYRLRSYNKRHDFDVSRFSVPVKFVSVEEAGKYVLESEVNIISPLIESKLEDTYFIWFTRWDSRDHNLDKALTISLKIKDGEVKIKSYNYREGRDLQSSLFFTDPDYIRDLKRRY